MTPYTNISHHLSANLPETGEDRGDDCPQALILPLLRHAHD